MLVLGALAGLAGLGAATSLLACGGGAKAHPAETASGGGSSSPGAADDAGSASTTGDAGSASSAQSAAATPDAGSASASSTDAPSSAKGDIKVDDGDDACQSAAAAFEKRARPQIKACYREGKKKDASLVGGVRIAINVTAAGKVGNVMSSQNGDKKLLPPAVVKCMVDGVKQTDAAELGACKGKSLAIPVQFPSQ